MRLSEWECEALLVLNFSTHTHTQEEKNIHMEYITFATFQYCLPFSSKTLLCDVYCAYLLLSTELDAAIQA